VLVSTPDRLTRVAATVPPSPAAAAPVDDPSRLSIFFNDPKDG
jgi:hypothetical protein